MSKKQAIGGASVANSKQFVPSGQNPSGHITMDSQQARFFQEIMAKDHRMMKLQQWGLLEHKRDRNPLAAERSPRGEFIGFDFSVPKKEPEKERWQYPDNDWGLMAKFSTQKPVYDVIFQREKDMPKMMEERNRIREANQARIQKVIREQKAIAFQAEEESRAEERRLKDLEDMLENPQKYHDDNKQRIKAAKMKALRLRQQQEAMDTSLLDDNDATHNSPQNTQPLKHHLSLPLDHFLDPNHDKTDHSSLAAVARSTKQNLKKIKEEFQSKNHLEDFKVSTIKGLQTKTPQVLAEYRATRAANFIAKQGERALHPPPIMPADVPFFETVPAFRGGGILIASTKELEVQAKKNEQAKKLLQQGLKTSALRSLQKEQEHTHPAGTQDYNKELILLHEQLADTEKEIDRQKLKMALNKKPMPASGQKRASTAR